MADLISETLAGLASILFGLGMCACAFAMYLDWRFRSDFRTRTGEELFPIEEILERYPERPWRLFAERPAVERHAGRLVTMRLDDPRLAPMWARTRRWNDVASALFGLAAVIMLVRTAWFLLATPL